LDDQSSPPVTEIVLPHAKRATLDPPPFPPAPAAPPDPPHPGVPVLVPQTCSVAFAHVGYVAPLAQPLSTLVHRGVKVPFAPAEPAVPFPPFPGAYPLALHLGAVDGAPFGAAPAAVPVPAVPHTGGTGAMLLLAPLEPVPAVPA
jgi:hypothetical protein